jgi:hypothetical protein
MARDWRLKLGELRDLAGEAAALVLLTDRLGEALDLPEFVPAHPQPVRGPLTVTAATVWLTPKRACRPNRRSSNSQMESETVQCFLTSSLNTVIIEPSENQIPIHRQ